jgi:hypothetical protein
MRVVASRTSVARPVHLILSWPKEHQQVGEDATRPGPSRAGHSVFPTNHEQASFSLAVPGPLVGGRAFFVSTP